MKQTNNSIPFAPTGREMSPRELIRTCSDDGSVKYSETVSGTVPCELSCEERDALCRIFLSDTYDSKPGVLIKKKP